MATNFQTEMAVGGIYVFLSAQEEPLDLQWAFCFRTKPVDGDVYQIQARGAGWISQYPSTDEIMASATLVGLFQIAAVEDLSLEKIDGIMTKHTSSITTDREWFKWISSLLQEEGILKCRDMETLEAEILDFKNRYVSNDAKAATPRPIGASQTCEL